MDGVILTDQGNNVSVVLLDVLYGVVGIVAITSSETSIQLVVNDDQQIDDPQRTRR